MAKVKKSKFSLFNIMALIGAILIVPSLLKGSSPFSPTGGGGGGSSSSSNFRVNDIRIVGIKLDGFTKFKLQLLLNIHNFTILSIPITAINLDLQLNGKNIGSIVRTGNSVSIPAQASATLRLENSVSISSLGLEILAAIQNGTSIKETLLGQQLTISGTVHSGVFNQSVNEIIRL